MATTSRVHRELVLTHPYAHGDDVRAVQKAARTRLARRGQLERYPITVDGVFGPQSEHACTRAAFLLGASTPNVQRAEHGHLIKGLQRLIRYPSARGPAQLARALARRHAEKNAPTVMYDSVTVSQIPAGARAVAGYTTGKFPTFPELVRQFPKARHLSIAVSSEHDAECLDVEPGDATPEVAAGWVKRQFARGIKRPVVYGSRDNIPAILAALAKAGIGRARVRVWSAHFTGVPHICGPKTCGASFTADAAQWNNRALGRNLDESRVSPGFWN